MFSFEKKKKTKQKKGNFFICVSQKQIKRRKNKKINIVVLERISV